MEQVPKAAFSIVTRAFKAWIRYSPAGNLKSAAGPVGEITFNLLSLVRKYDGCQWLDRARKTPQRYCRMIPDPLDGASNEDKVHVTRHKFRVHGGTRNELFAEVTVKASSSLSFSLSVRASS